MLKWDTSRQGRLGKPICIYTETYVGFIECNRCTRYALIPKQTTLTTDISGLYKTVRPDIDDILAWVGEKSNTDTIHFLEHAIKHQTIYANRLIKNTVTVRASILLNGWFTFWEFLQGGNNFQLRNDFKEIRLKEGTCEKKVLICI